LLKEIYRLRAALQPSPVDAWRDISSAPRDVPCLLAFSTDAEKPFVCMAYWDAYYAEGGSGYQGGDGWVIQNCGEEVRLHFSAEPTHWQPLPACPSDKSGV